MYNKANIFQLECISHVMYNTYIYNALVLHVTFTLTWTRIESHN